MSEPEQAVPKTISLRYWIGSGIRALRVRFLNDRTRRASWTMMAMLVAQFIGKLAGLISVPLVLGFLGKEEYGLWLTASTLIGWLALADFGLGSGLMTKLSEAFGSGDVDKQRRLVTNSLFAQFVIVLFITICFLVAFPFLNLKGIFNVSGNSAVGILPAMVLLIFASFAIQFGLSVVTTVYRAFQEGYIWQLWVAAGSLTNLASILLVIEFHGDAVDLVLAMVAAPAFVSLLNASWMFAFHKRALFPRRGDISWKTIKSIGSLGMKYSALAICTVMSSQAAYFIIAHYMGAAQVTPYGVAMKIFAIVQGVGAAVIMPMWPAYSEAISTKDFSWVKKMHSIMLRLNKLLWVGFGACFVFLGPALILLWVGPSGVPPRMLLLGIALQGLAFSQMGVYTTLLNGAQFVRQQFVPTILVTALTLALMIMMGSTWGTVGVIWGSALGSVLGWVVFSGLTNRLIEPIVRGV